MSHPYRLGNEAAIPGPALAVFPDIIRKNIARLIELAGAVDPHPPHVKAHKTREIVKLQLDAGVTKHKCATIGEAEMLADVGAPDVLFAYPLVGPNLKRFTALVKKYPNTRFSALIDDPAMADALSEAAVAA